MLLEKISPATGRLHDEEEQQWGALIVGAAAGRWRAVQVVQGIRSRNSADAHIDEAFGLLEVDAQA